MFKKALLPTLCLFLLFCIPLLVFAIPDDGNSGTTKNSTEPKNTGGVNSSGGSGREDSLNAGSGSGSTAGDKDKNSGSGSSSGGGASGSWDDSSGDSNSDKTNDGKSNSDKNSSYRDQSGEYGDGSAGRVPYENKSSSEGSGREDSLNAYSGSGSWGGEYAKSILGASKYSGSILTGAIKSVYDTAATYSSRTAKAVGSIIGGRKLTEAEVQERAKNYLISRMVETSWSYKDKCAAERLGITVEEYVIGGIDPEFAVNLYNAGKAMEAEGIKLEITSGFRDDFRQGLITDGTRASVGHSWHGGSAVTEGYGDGQAVDISGAAAQKWVDENGSEYGITRPYKDADPYHVAAANSGEVMHDGTTARSGRHGGMTDAEVDAIYKSNVSKESKSLYRRVKDGVSSIFASTEPTSTESKYTDLPKPKPTPTPTPAAADDEIVVRTSSSGLKEPISADTLLKTSPSEPKANSGFTNNYHSSDSDSKDGNYNPSATDINFKVLVSMEDGTIKKDWSVGPVTIANTDQLNFSWNAGGAFTKCLANIRQKTFSSKGNTGGTTGNTILDNIDVYEVTGAYTITCADFLSKQAVASIQVTVQ